jgi:hypothetical protein
MAPESEAITTVDIAAAAGPADHPTSIMNFADRARELAEPLRA